MSENEIDVKKKMIKGFFKDLSRFDWFYEMSDDHRVWKEGEAAKSSLLALIRIMDDVNQDTCLMDMYKDFKAYYAVNPEEGVTKPKLEDYI